MSKKVLIVDDDQNFASLVKKMLASAGYDAVLAKSGQEAVMNAVSMNVDLVLMDLNMTDWDGKMASDFLERMVPDLNIIIVSGSEDKALLDRMSEHKNIFGIVAKPFKVEELMSLVKTALGEG